MDALLGKLFESLTAQNIWGAVFVAFLIGFARYIVIPMKDRHFQFMDVVEATQKTGQTRLDSIDNNLVEIRQTLKDQKNEICRAMPAHA